MPYYKMLLRDGAHLSREGHQTVAAAVIEAYDHGEFTFDIKK